MLLSFDKPCNRYETDNDSYLYMLYLFRFKNKDVLMLRSVKKNKSKKNILIVFEFSGIQVIRILLSLSE